jgi:hypothetical protein
LPRTWRNTDGQQRAEVRRVGLADGCVEDLSLGELLLEPMDLSL